MVITNQHRSRKVVAAKGEKRRDRKEERKKYKPRKGTKKRFYVQSVSTERLPKNIRPQECMHQGFYKKSHRKDNKAVYPQIVEPKVNGIRCFASIKKPSVTLFNRTGKPFSSLQELEQELFAVIDPREHFYLDGELVDEEFNEKRTRARGRTHDLVNIKDKYLGKHKLHFFVFDLILRREFDHPHLMPTLEHRKRRLMDWCEKHKLLLKSTKLLPYVSVESDESLFKLHKKFLAGGFEGTCIKNPRSKYSPKGRNKDWRKIKPNETVDLVVVDVSFGSKQHSYRDWAIATITCAGYDPHTDMHVTAKVFQGIPWDLRGAWRADPRSILGKVVEIGYYNVVKTSKKLNYPYFIRVREDKDAKEIQVNHEIGFDRLRELERLEEGEHAKGNGDSNP